MIYFVLLIFLTKGSIYSDISIQNINLSQYFIQSQNTVSDKVDIAGHWEGTITRDEGAGRRSIYRMEVDVNQKGKDISGVSYLHFEDTEGNQYHAKMAFVGKLNNTFFKYLETKIITADTIPGTEWCIKRAELIFRLQDSKPTLEGLWEGITSQGECTPGRIFLEKKPPRA